jgi:phage/plasmid-like protein (TIGR03299 family)
MVAAVETMAYAGDVPWHGLGTRVSNDISIDDMLRESGLDWKVIPVPVYGELNGERIESNYEMLIRGTDQKVLTMITDKWNPVQNLEAFEFFREFIDAGSMEMHTAGSLQDGKWVWVLAKVADSFELFGGDKVDSYLLFSNPHIYGRAVEVRFTPIRVVCNNTLNLSLGKKTDSKIRLNHRSTFDSDMVKETLGIASEKMATYKEMAQFLGTKSYKTQIVAEYFKEVFPGYSKKAIDQANDVKTLTEAQIEALGLSRNAKGALDLVETQPGADFAPGTWWNAYNAVSYMTDHVIGRSQESRLTSSWYGLNKSVKVKALQKAIEYAEAA